MDEISLKIDKEKSLTFTKFILYDDLFEKEKDSLNNSFFSYMELLGNIRELLLNDKNYFEMNDKARSRVLELINMKRYDSKYKELVPYFNEFIIELNSINDTSNYEISNYIMSELNIRFSGLTKKYVPYKLKKNKLNFLKISLLGLEDFDYQYLNLIDINGYDSINKNNINEFVSSTNYFLNRVPELFIIDNNRPLNGVTEVLEKYKKDPLVRRTYDKVKKKK